MTDKQVIDELKNDVACKENIINHLAEHNIKLQAQLKAKELECEGWKNRSDEWMSKYEQETKLREFINEQLDQLKAEYEQEKTLKEMYFTYYKAKHGDIKGEFFRYKQALAEIKEICSEMNCESLMQNSWCGNTDFKMGCCERLFKKQILQIINEVENES